MTMNERTHDERGDVTYVQVTLDTAEEIIIAIEEIPMTIKQVDHIREDIASNVNLQISGDAAGGGLNEGAPKGQCLQKYQENTKLETPKTVPKTVPVILTQVDNLKEDKASNVNFQIYGDVSEGGLNEGAPKGQRLQKYQENTNLETPKTVPVILTQSEYFKSEQEKLKNDEKCEADNARDFEYSDVINIEPRKILPVYPEDEHNYYNSMLQEGEEPGGYENHTAAALDTQNIVPVKRVLEVTPEGTILQPVKKGTILQPVQTYEDYISFKCMYTWCSQSFENISQLRNHLVNIHTKKRPLNGGIEVTPEIFISEPDQTNNPKETFKCMYTGCGHSFTDIKGLQFHLSTVHTEKPALKCTQPDCFQEFSDITRLKNHVGRIHNMKPWQCDHCSLTFTDTWHLGRHFSRDHPNFHQYKCVICNKGFPSRDIFRTHQQVSPFCAMDHT